MNMESLWNRTCQLLMQAMPSVSYDTWVNSNLSPAMLEGNTLILSVNMESMRDMVQKRYGALIDK